MSGGSACPFLLLPAGGSSEHDSDYRQVREICHCAMSVVLLEFWYLKMERTPGCYFVVAIVDSKEGDIAVVVDCIDYWG